MNSDYINFQLEKYREETTEKNKDREHLSLSFYMSLSFLADVYHQPFAADELREIAAKKVVDSLVPFLSDLLSTISFDGPTENDLIRPFDSKLAEIMSEFGSFLLSDYKNIVNLLKICRLLLAL